MARSGSWPGETVRPAAPAGDWSSPSLAARRSVSLPLGAGGGHKNILRGGVPEVLARKCLLNFLYSDCMAGLMAQY